MYRSAFPATPVVFALLLAAVPVRAVAQAPPGAPAPTAPPPAVAGSKTPSDLDAFMARVLARRAVNRTTLAQYVLDETEAFEVTGPGGVPLTRSRREFTWYARDGMHVRSPVKFDGVTVDEPARRAYEEEWITRERARAERRAKRQADAAGTPGKPAPGEQAAPATSATAAEPRFVSEAYFMDFTFEPGNYYLAGREQLEGHDVLRIEYYPSNLFNDSDDEKRPREMKRRRDERQEADIDRRMNKTALVTLWVDPAEPQIVKYTFDNVWLDFLPGAWLVRVDDIRASMTMGQPIAGVWLPRAIDIRAGVTLAAGSFKAGYDRTFTNYREAEVRTTIKVPKTDARLEAARPRLVAARWTLPQAPAAPSAPPPRLPDGAAASMPGRDPSVTDQPRVETIHEIRVHGNAFLTDQEVLALAGVTVGTAVTPGIEEAVARRLRDSRRFETVDVRRRYRSLDDPTDVALIVLVHERPGVVSTTAGGSGEAPSAWRRLTAPLQFFPILSYEDGYGLTYGGRATAVNLLGGGDRFSVPLTWGGTRRAALEFERGFTTGPLTRVTSSVETWNRDNPRYDLAEHRVQVSARAERLFAKVLRTGVDVSAGSVTFGALDDRPWSLGASAALDTRHDPAFPSNAVVLGGGWSALHVAARRINRYNAAARGYLRVFRQNVVAGRVQYATADAPLPLYERPLLGGASTLRGDRAGAFDGDRLAVASVELRAPLTSVLSRAKLGLTLFADAGKAADFGAALGDAPWHHGTGAGLFLVAPFVQLNLNVAHGESAGTRLNVSTGFSF